MSGEEISRPVLPVEHRTVGGVDQRRVFVGQHESVLSEQAAQVGGGRVVDFHVETHS